EPDGAMVADAVLRIQKSGNYLFTASAYGLFDYHFSDEYDPENAAGQIAWGAEGQPADGATGDFPLTIRWNKNAMPAADVPMPMEAESVTLEVREADEPD